MKRSTPIDRPTRCAARAAIQIFALACALALAGCPSRSHAPGDAAALARTQAPLAWNVDHAQVTHHLSTSSMESRDALPGHQFVVLDVSVRNQDAQPQVLSEGKLIALDESQLQTFDQPETLLSDDYLSLQVLAPAQSLHGKIAYEVPEPLSGVLYWSPGNGSERILLNPVAAPTPAPTLANAEVDDDNAAAARIEPDHDATVVERAATDVPARVAEAKTTSKPQPVVATIAAAEPAAPRIVIDVPEVATAQTQVDPQTSTALDASIAAPADSTPSLSPTPAASLPSAALAVARPSTASVPMLARPRVAATESREPVRRQACQALVSRDDPADKAGSLAFFAASCRDYALPASWRPQPAPRRSLLARVKARAEGLLARVMIAPRAERISGCGATASRADKLVCADPGLSAMDQRLARSLARARGQVDDPDALQREQTRWRGHVRDACGTARCLEKAYGHRIAQLDAMSPRRD